VDQRTCRQLRPFNLFLVAILTIPLARAAGCEDLLAQGVFDTFNATSGHQTFNQWHQWWCNGVVEKTSSGNTTGATLNVVVQEIPLGLSFDNAQQFQKLYQQQFCGTGSSSSTDLRNDSSLAKVASKQLIDAYTACKEIENRGISSRLDMGSTNASFVLQMRYNRPITAGGLPKITDITFLPSGSVSCQGSLVTNRSLSENNKVLACQRKSNAAIQLVVNTDAGAFTRNIPSITPPPTATDLVLAALPTGTILPWAAKVPIPSGWRLCDGQAGTPDLRDRYPQGTGTASLVGSQIGADSHTHQVDGTTNIGNGFQPWVPGHQFQTQGPNTFVQTYSFSSTSAPASNLPPSTKIQFIMKL
jgi:hypothetical protein